MSNPGATAEQHIVSVNGVVQKPNSGTSQPSEGFAIDGSSIIFSSAPPSSADFFIITIGSTVNIGTPSDGTVSTSKLANGAVTTVKIADDAVNAAKLASDAVVTASIVDDAVTADKLANSINSEIAANTAKTSNATHTGEVTGGTALTIADNVVDEANLKVSNSPSNGYFLSAQSGNTGGLTWAQVTTDLVGDTSPQLGGNLDVNGANIVFPDSSNAGTNLNRLKFGVGTDLQIYHNSNDTSSYVTHDNGSGHLYLQGDAIKLRTRSATSNETYIACSHNGPVTIYHDDDPKLQTQSDGVRIEDGGLLYLQNGSENAASHIRNSEGTGESNFVFNTYDGSSSVDRWEITKDGHFIPQVNNDMDIGASSYRVRNIYTNDLHLSNEGHSNDVDGTWGNWTIQEGESDLFLKNNRSGKKYKFNLTEVS
ncbi:hypothetical protein [uncultured phage MedDCM-OCT-S08-C239]|nr:hypothetical protein [uncultured phage MedDCM-OCT-S08-C239]